MHPRHGRSAPKSTSCKVGITDLEAMLLSLYEMLDLVFRTIKSRGVTLRTNKNDRTIRVDFPDCPFLLLWTKPNAPYICIEPWCNGPDFIDAPAAIDQKPGFTRVEKGQTVKKHHVITIG